MEIISKLKFTKNKVFANKLKENEIFISRKRKNIEEFYYTRAHELILEKNYKEIYVCGLGSCLNHAVNVALIITDCLPSMKIENIETESISHVDDYKNVETNEIEVRKQDRMSNLVKIKLIKK